MVVWPSLLLECVIHSTSARQLWLMACSARRLTWGIQPMNRFVCRYQAPGGGDVLLPWCCVVQGHHLKLLWPYVPTCHRPEPAVMCNLNVPAEEGKEEQLDVRPRQGLLISVGL